MLLTASWDILGAGSAVGQGPGSHRSAQVFGRERDGTALWRRPAGEAPGAEVRVGLASVPPCPLHPFLPALPLV